MVFNGDSDSVISDGARYYAVGLRISYTKTMAGFKWEKILRMNRQIAKRIPKVSVLSFPRHHRNTIVNRLDGGERD
jgi:hypothetical protein